MGRVIELRPPTRNSNTADLVLSCRDLAFICVRIHSKEFALNGFLRGSHNGAVSTESVPSGRTPLRTRTVLFWLAVLLLGGLAQGKLQAQTAYFSGAVTTLGGGFNAPAGVAVDASGNIYVTDVVNNAVYEIPPGCASASCVIMLGGGFGQPQGIAVAANGTIYVADVDAALMEMPPGCASASCVTMVPGFSLYQFEPTGVTTDASGNLYFTAPHVLWEIPAGCSSYSCFVNLSPLNLLAPYGVAVDTSGNVYVADIEQGVYELPQGCTTAGYQSGSCKATQLGVNFNSPYDVALDASGNVYVAAAGVYEMPPGCTPSSNCVSQVAAGFGNPTEGLALDGSGNIYVADTLHAKVREIQRHGVNFGTVAVRSSGNVVTLNFNFTATDSGIGTSVLTQGASGLDFVDAKSGSCDPNGATYSSTAGSSCTVDVTFSPKYAGARYGAVQLSDATGVIATAYIYGTGQGPQLVFPSNQNIQTLGGGYRSPESVAVDGTGNVYVADASTGAVTQIPPGCASAGCVTRLGGGFSLPSGVAIDGAGNVYVADLNNNAVKEMPPSCASANCVSTLGGGFSQPSGVAIDGNGNVYVADLNNNAVKGMPPGCASASCVTTLGSGFSQPFGVAVDGCSNIYVADTDDSAVKRMPPGCASASCVTTLGGGFAAPLGVAVHGSGNVYVADYANNAVKEMPPGCASASCVTALSGGFRYPYGVAVDGNGNVYIADTGNIAVKAVNFAAPPSLSFASTNVGSQSSDGPQAVTLQNIGNAPLSFPVLGAGENPSISTSFTLDSTTTCPEVLTSSSPGTLPTGATCTLAMDFIPTTAGSINGIAVLTDNNLNISSATQTIYLFGTGLNSIVSVSIGTNPIGLSFSINGTPYSTTQAPSLNIGTEYTLSTTSPQAGGPGVQYVFSQWSDGTTSLIDLLTPTAGTSNDTAQFTAQYMLTVTAGSGGTIGASTAPNAFYTPATVQAIAATPNAGYYFVGWTGVNSPSDIANATSATTFVTMNGPENLTANFAPIPNLQVTTLNDDATGNASNCSPPSSNCSLRDAITAIEANNGSTGSITFAKSLNGTITLSGALPALSGQITITGPGASNLTVSGGNTVQVFYVASGAASISGLTIANGNSAGSGNGGGIYNNGSLTVNNSAFTGNSANTYGGGIYSGFSNNLIVTDSTFSGNSAGTEGGGIYGGGGALLSVSNSTFFDNSAGFGGGGIYWCCYYASVSSTTISGNTAKVGAGFYNNNGDLTISNSIMAGNTTTLQAGDDCDGCGTQSPYNLISTPSNIMNPDLAPLSNYGGPTQTMLPLPGTAVICSGSSALIPTGINRDQRGFSNSTTYNGTQCYDLGAVQTNYALSFNATQEPPSTGTLPSFAMSPAPAVTVTESGNPFTGGSASVTLTDANSDLTTSPATETTSTSNGQAAFSTLIFTGATSGDTLTATLALNPGTAGLNLTATSTTFSVAPGTPVVAWPTASAITYGQTLVSSTLNGGSASFNNTSVPGSFAFTNPSTMPSSGTQMENVTFTPNNASAYNSVNGTVSVLVNKAPPMVAFTGAPANAPYQATFAVTATTNASTTAVITAGGSCSIVGTTVTITASSGTCSLAATWAADSNYVAGSATQTTTAIQATPVITWTTPAAITYGTALSTAQLDAIAAYNGAAVAGKFVYAPSKGTVLGAGSQTLSVIFMPTSTNYTSASTSVILQVNQATPKITWAKPAAITYGTALSGTQLDATASVPGALVYSPAAGTILQAGTQTHSVTFTPTDAVDYTATIASVTLSVAKATPVVTWPTPSPISYGTPLSSSQLDATASVPGTFVYSPAAGKVEPAGSDRLSVTFTPTDAVDYATVTASVTLQVGHATPTINWATPAAIKYGTALSSSQLNATATSNGVTVAGTFVYTPPKGTVLGVGSQTLSVTFTPTNTTDYVGASASVTLQVNQARPKITWAKPVAITYGTALSSTQLDATASVPGTLVYSPATGTVLPGGIQTLSVSFSPTDAVDYTTARDSVSITVSLEASTTAITANTPDLSAVGQAVLVGFSVDGANGVPTGTVTVTASTGQSCTGTLSGGTGSCALTFTATGSPKLTAVYSGDINFKTSTSAKVTQTVN